MRDLALILKIVIACILGYFLHLFLHEIGHVVFALISGNEITDVGWGITSFTDVQIKNAETIPLISVGSFILPVVICAILELFRSEFIKIVNGVIIAITGIQLAINAIAVVSIQDIKILKTYDLGLLVYNMKANNVLVCVIAMFLALLLFVWAGCKIKEFTEKVA